MVKNKNENEALYGGISPPPKGATPPNEGKELSPLTLCLAWRSCFYTLYLPGCHGYTIHVDFCCALYTNNVGMDVLCFFYVYIGCHGNMNECEP